MRQLPAGCPERVRDGIDSCVAELANNALAHTLSGRPGGDFTITVYTTTATVRVEVADGGPIPMPPQTEDWRHVPESGWGLGLVSCLATRMGAIAWFEREWGTQP